MLLPYVCLYVASYVDFFCVIFGEYNRTGYYSMVDYPNQEIRCNRGM